jgi:hypothetical protein
MKAALVSATSLAALLAFEVGLDVAIDAHPARATSFIVEQPILNFGVVLLNSSVTTSVMTETVSNNNGFGNNITFPAVATTPFSGASVSTAVGANATATHAYTLSLPFGSTIGTSSLQSTISSGAANKTAVTLTATAVAPQESTSGAASLNFGTIRAGTTIAAITVANTLGNGDLYSSTLAAAQLQVSLGASNSVFTPAVNTFSLNDTHYTPGTGVSVTTANYVFAPTVHGVGESTTATINFLNGGSNTNTTASSTVHLTATGVGPVFKGVYNGTTYTNATAIGTSVNNAGSIGLGTQKHGTTTTFQVTVSNATTDTPSTLTNLTLNGFSLGTCVVTGCTFDGFSVLSFATTPATIAEGSSSVTMTLDFSGGLQTYYDADLSFDTDQGAATGVGGTGAVFNYLLTANIPEPATIVTFGMGLAGLGWVRRRRAARRSAISTDASPA